MLSNHLLQRIGEISIPVSIDSHRRDSRNESEHDPKGSKLLDANVTFGECHLQRIYFSGTNLADSTATADGYVPESSRSVLLDEEFSQLCKEINRIAAWSRFEKWSFAISSFIYSPLALILAEDYRNKKSESVSSFVESTSHDFAQSEEARKEKDSVKFGHSSCGSLMWLDVFCAHQEDVTPFTRGKPCLPMLLVCAGDGLHLSPYQFDIADPLVKCVGEYFGPKWFIFLANLNGYLRSVNVDSFDRYKLLSKAKGYVDMMQLVGIGIGKRMPVGGVDVELVFCPPKNAHDIGRPALLIHSSSPQPSDDQPLSPRTHGIKSVLIEDMVQEHKEWLSQKSSCSLFAMPFNFVSVMFFKRKARKSSRLFLFWLFFILLLAELWINLAIITGFVQIIPAGFWFFMLIQPLANLLSPLIGLCSLILSSSVMTRVFTVFNGCSMWNAAMSLIWGGIAVHRRSLTELFGFGIPILLIFVKLALSQIALGYLPHLEYDKDLLLSRVDILRDEDLSPRLSYIQNLND
jgi:hypothetical protein